MPQRRKAIPMPESSNIRSTGAWTCSCPTTRSLTGSARAGADAATGPPQWEPGFASLTWVTVELEPEPANQYETAVAGGWKAETS